MHDLFWLGPWALDVLVPFFSTTCQIASHLLCIRLGVGERGGRIAKAEKKGCFISPYRPYQNRADPTFF